MAAETGGRERDGADTVEPSRRIVFNAHGSWSFELGALLGSYLRILRRHGEKYRGEVEVYPAMPHSPGDAVAVRYIPSDPTIVREEYRIREARKPLPKSVFVPIAWGVNAIFAA